MIQTIHGNLFENLNSNEFNIIIHGCNAQGKMNSGFAKELRERYPEAYTTYFDEYNNHGLQLGTNVYYNIDNSTIIANAITQKYYGYDGQKYVDYKSIESCFNDLNNFLLICETEVVNVNFPKIGAGLAGGDWDTISNIIENTLDNKFNKKLYVL